MNELRFDFDTTLSPFSLKFKVFHNEVAVDVTSTLDKIGPTTYKIKFMPTSPGMWRLDIHVGDNQIPAWRKDFNVRYEMVKLDKLWVGFDHALEFGDSFEKLKTSIAEHGVITPISVLRENSKVIDGAQRFYAANALGLSDIPVFWLDKSESEIIKMTLIESCPRVATSPEDYAKAIKRIMEKDNLTLEQVAEKCDLTLDALNERLPYCRNCANRAVADLCATCFGNGYRMCELKGCLTVVSGHGMHACSVHKCAGCFQVKAEGSAVCKYCILKTRLCILCQKTAADGSNYCLKHKCTVSHCFASNYHSGYCQDHAVQSCKYCGVQTAQKICNFCISRGARMCSCGVNAINHTDFCANCTCTSANCKKARYSGSYCQDHSGSCEKCGIATWGPKHCDKCAGIKITYLDEENIAKMIDEKIVDSIQLSPKERGKHLCLEPDCKVWLKKKVWCEKHLKTRVDHYPTHDRDGDAIFVYWAHNQHTGHAIGYHGDYVKVKDMDNADLNNVFWDSGNKKRNEAIGGNCKHPAYDAVIAECKKRDLACNSCDDGVVFWYDTTDGDAEYDFCLICPRGIERQKARALANEMSVDARNRSIKRVLAMTIIACMSMLAGGVAYGGWAFVLMCYHMIVK